MAAKAARALLHHPTHADPQAGNTAAGRRSTSRSSTPPGMSVTDPHQHRHHLTDSIDDSVRSASEIVAALEEDGGCVAPLSPKTRRRRKAVGFRMHVPVGTEDAAVVQNISELIMEARQRKLDRLRTMRRSFTLLMSSEETERCAIERSFTDLLFGTAMSDSYTQGRKSAHARTLKTLQSTTAPFTSGRLATLEGDHVRQVIQRTSLDLLAVLHLCYLSQRQLLVDEETGFQLIRSREARMAKVLSKAATSITRLFRTNATRKKVARQQREERQLMHQLNLVFVVELLVERRRWKLQARSHRALMRSAFEAMQLTSTTHAQQLLRLFEVMCFERLLLLQREHSQAAVMQRVVVFQLLEEKVFRPLCEREAVAGIASIRCDAFSAVADGYLRKHQREFQRVAICQQEDVARMALTNSAVALLSFNVHIALTKIVPWWRLRALRLKDRQLRRGRERLELHTVSAETIQRMWRGHTVRRVQQETRNSIARLQVDEATAREATGCDLWGQARLLWASHHSEPLQLLEREAHQRRMVEDLAVLEGQGQGSPISQLQQAAALHRLLRPLVPAYHVRRNFAEHHNIHTEERRVRLHWAAVEGLEFDQQHGRWIVERDARSASLHLALVASQEMNLVQQLFGERTDIERSQLLEAHDLSRSCLEPAMHWVAQRLLGQYSLIRRVGAAATTRKRAASHWRLAKEEKYHRLLSISAAELLERYQLVADELTDQFFYIVFEVKRALRKLSSLNFQEKVFIVEKLEEPVQRKEVEDAAERWVELCGMEARLLSSAGRIHLEPTTATDQLHAVQVAEKAARHRLAHGHEIEGSTRRLLQYHAVITEILAEDENDNSSSSSRSAAEGEGKEASAAAGAAAPEVPPSSLSADESARQQLEAVEAESRAVIAEGTEFTQSSARIEQMKVLFHEMAASSSSSESGGEEPRESESVEVKEAPSSRPVSPTIPGTLDPDTNAAALELLRSEATGRQGIEDSVEISATYQQLMMMKMEEEAMLEVLEDEEEEEDDNKVEDTTSPPPQQQQLPEPEPHPPLAEGTLPEAVLRDILAEEKHARHDLIRSIPNSASFQQVMLFANFIEAQLDEEDEEEEEDYDEDEEESVESSERGGGAFRSPRSSDADTSEDDSMASVGSVLWV